MKKIAVFAGTFDPPTLGHMWIIEKSKDLFDEVVVLVADNADKKPIFTKEERVSLFTILTKDYPNVTISTLENRYVADYAASIEAKYFVRGIRDAKDLEYEKTILEVNSSIDPTLEHVYLISPKGVSSISSSLVKSLIGPKGWKEMVARIVPPVVLKALIYKSKPTSDLWERLVKRDFYGNKDEFWNDLVSPYFESHRHYHDISHIYSMYEDFEEIRHLLMDEDIFEYDMWIHDSVYDVYAKDNEAKSAEKGDMIAKKYGKDSMWNHISMHAVQVTDHKTPPENTDEMYLVDIDLGVLGKSEEVYDEYAANIRKEYLWVEEGLYKSERIKVLQYFLNREHIYYTDHFRTKYEAKARENLIREISMLSK